MSKKDETWDDRYMGLVRLVSGWSKDRSTKVGAAVVDARNNLRVMGYNGFPRRVDDNIDSRHERPTKYLFTAHAEENCISQAAYMGVSLDGCRIYVSWLPCAKCSRAIIQAGISEIVTDNVEVPQRWKEEFIVSLKMLDEAGVVIRLPNSKKAICPKALFTLAEEQ